MLQIGSNKDTNEYQKSNNEILENTIDTTNKYQQQTINTIKSITNNFVELQKNLLDTYQSVLSRFLGDASESIEIILHLHKDMQIFTTRPPNYYR
ncbi:MAG TPA: hypothetical protein VF242_12550 [Nitrososphaeraceae archaeon]